MTSCSLDDQKVFYTEQCKKPTKVLHDKSMFLLHYSNEFCLYAAITENTKLSSEATATRDFIVQECSHQEMIDGDRDKMYVKLKK